uniref:Uncharacterized protein n=1 Tax=Anguilla anguilla TaxID=7936 RepID=A0A0E9RKX1_ANGAN
MQQMILCRANTIKQVHSHDIQYMGNSTKPGEQHSQTRVHMYQSVSVICTQ